MAQVSYTLEALAVCILVALAACILVARAVYTVWAVLAVGIFVVRVACMRKVLVVGVHKLVVWVDHNWVVFVVVAFHKQLVWVHHMKVLGPDSFADFEVGHILDWVFWEVHNWVWVDHRLASWALELDTLVALVCYT